MSFHLLPHKQYYNTLPYFSVVNFNCDGRSPCLLDDALIIENKYHFKHEDETKFVQVGYKCSTCNIMPCPPGLVWNDEVKACDWPRNKHLNPKFKTLKKVLKH